MPYEFLGDEYRDSGCSIRQAGTGEMTRGEGEPKNRESGSLRPITPFGPPVVTTEDLCHLC
jgi:hypothetical protein